MDWKKVYNWLKFNHSGLASHCYLCHRAISGRNPLCGDCHADLPWLTCACPRCGTPGISNRTCGRCQRQPPPIDRTIALMHYQPPVSQLVQQFKFNDRLSLGRLFSQALIARLQQQPCLPEAILPVPLHPRRQRQRGFNQAIEIARPVARALELPLLTRHIYRERHTEPQSELDARQRSRNLKNAFGIKRPIDYQHIAIVDDVITTGTTVRELAQTLRRAGIDRIECWAVAKTGR